MLCFFCQDSVSVPSPIQSARAANIIHSLFLYRKQILKEKLEPVGGYDMAHQITELISGRVVQTPVSTNPGLNFNPGFFFFLSKALSRIIFSIIFRVSNHQIVGKENSTGFAF